MLWFNWKLKSFIFVNQNENIWKFNIFTDKKEVILLNQMLFSLRNTYFNNSLKQNYLLRRF